MPPWSSELCNLYYMLRYRRNYDSAARRKYYRYIAVEKKRLLNEGVDPELLRLFCRHLADTKNRYAERRFLAYQSQCNLF
jgi:hypothetical protein